MAGGGSVKARAASRSSWFLFELQPDKGTFAATSAPSDRDSSHTEVFIDSAFPISSRAALARPGIRWSKARHFLNGMGLPFSNTNSTSSIHRSKAESTVRGANCSEVASAQPASTFLAQSGCWNLPIGTEYCFHSLGGENW